MSQPQVTPDASPLPSLLFSPFISDPRFLAAVSGLFVLLLVTFYVLNQRSKENRTKTVLILGTTESGKTALFTNLIYGQHLPTHTSIQPNSGILQLGTNAFRLVDIPGHPRIRGQFSEYLLEAKGIIFTVDSNTVARNGAAVAEHIHVLLSALAPLSKPPRLLLLATKSDLLAQGSTVSPDSTAAAQGRVSSVLERELEKRRLSSANQKSGGAMEGLGAVVGSEKRGLFGGVGGKEVEEISEESVLEAGPDGVWRFGDEWETGAVWVGPDSKGIGLDGVTSWLEGL